MTRREVDRKLLRILEDAERVLNRWRYAVSENGGLWIRPEGPRLNTKELSSFLRLLTDVFAVDPPTEVVFNMNRIRFLGPNWTLALAMFIDFAQQLGVPCHIDGVQGSPPLLRHCTIEVRKCALLSACDGTSLDPARQSA